MDVCISPLIKHDVHNSIQLQDYCDLEGDIYVATADSNAILPTNCHIVTFENYTPIPAMSFERFREFVENSLRIISDSENIIDKIMNSLMSALKAQYDMNDLTLYDIDIINVAGRPLLLRLCKQLVTMIPVPDVGPKTVPLATMIPSQTEIDEAKSAVDAIYTEYGHTKSTPVFDIDINDYKGESGVYHLRISEKNSNIVKLYKYGYCDDLCEDLLNLMTYIRKLDYRVVIYSITYATKERSEKIIKMLNNCVKQNNCGRVDDFWGNISLIDINNRLIKYADATL